MLSLCSVAVSVSCVICVHVIERGVGADDVAGVGPKQGGELGPLVGC
jgi:hypothetical protein